MQTLQTRDQLVSALQDKRLLTINRDTICPTCAFPGGLRLLLGGPERPRALHGERGSISRQVVVLVERCSCPQAKC